MYISNCFVRTNMAYNNSHSKMVMNKERNEVPSKSAYLSNPCDAKYLLKRNNVNFGAKYKLTKLSPDKLKALKESVTEKAHDLGADNFEFSDPKNWESNYVAQAMDKLVNSPIAKKGNIDSSLRRIYAKILTNHNEKEDSEALMEMVDFLSSKEVEKVVNHPNVAEKIGDILCSNNKYNIEYKKDFINYLNENHEILAKKDICLGEYINRVYEYTYTDLKDLLSLPNPPKHPEVNKKVTSVPGNRVDRVVKTAIETAKNKKNPDEVRGFARVGGQRKAIDTIRKKVIFPRLYPELYKGRNIEKGAILTGPPGTGKSLLAKALSEECNCNFYSIGASDMKEKWVGSTEENWRGMFETLKKNQPSILFIDEADSLCKKRGGQDVHGDTELNAFLKLVSDIKSENVDTYILLATNNIKAFDDAILRDGRFGTKIEMLPPENIEAVEEIFNIHKKGLVMDKDVEENKVGLFNKMLELKLTGANIEGVVNQAHEEALSRMGLFDKMLNGTVTPKDIENFSIKAEDIYSALAKRDTSKVKKIGFNK